MAWLRIRFHCDRDRAQQVSAAMEAHGACAVSMENASGGAYFDNGPPVIPDWREVYVTGMFEDGVDADRVAKSIQQEVGQGAVRRVAIDALQDQDWLRACSRAWQPVKITDELWVCPDGVSPPSTGATTVTIDPGLGFGTGTHPTTQLCLQWLAETDITGKQVFDYGCGSGILAIAAIKLGAAHAWACDVDPLAIRTTCSNAKKNNVVERLTVLTSCGAWRRPVDVVIANILESVIISLHETLTALVCPRGFILLTGILHNQEQRVRDVFGASFEFECRARNEWRLLIGRRTG